jgi:UDP-N-acetylglucosamine:LPS N-acetylglucosamine transferase
VRDLRRRAPNAALGFTEDVGDAMRLGDFVTGKPGPSCLSEAVHLRLPVVTFRNAWTMPQERYNTERLRETSAGLEVSPLSRLAAVVAQRVGTACRPPCGHRPHR